MDKVLAAQPLTVPVMLVHSLWDQEDIYGAIAVYKALEPKDTANDKVFLVHGPVASRPGDRRRQHARRAEVRQRHRAVLPPGDPAAVPRSVPEGRRAEGGRPAGHRLRDRHQHVAAPARVAGRLRERLHACEPTPLYLARGAQARASPRRQPATRAFDEYVSDPAKPVPFRARPIQPIGYDDGLTWPRWLVDDQREASGRPDVLAFVSDVLTAPVKISGQPVANLVASTSGTDSDWVVKLIDVYPDEVAGQPAMGGYQLMVSADIFRGRYRESLETPEADRGRTSRCSTASRCPRRTTCSCRATGSWCRCSRAGSRSTTATRRRSCRTSSGRSRRTTGRRCSAIYHAPGQASFIELPVVEAR